MARALQIPYATAQISPPFISLYTGLINTAELLRWKIRVPLLNHKAYCLDCPLKVHGSVGRQCFCGLNSLFSFWLWLRWVGRVTGRQRIGARSAVFGVINGAHSVLCSNGVPPSQLWTAALLHKFNYCASNMCHKHKRLLGVQISSHYSHRLCNITSKK